MAGDTSLQPGDVADATTTEIFDTTRIARSKSPSNRRGVHRVCLIGEAAKDLEIVSLLKDHFHVKVFESVNGDEFKNDSDMLFVCPDFDDYPFKYLNSLEKRIIGPPVIRHRASLGKPLIMPRPNRALYNESMANVCVVFSGVSNKKCRYAVDLIHHMGGSARKGFSASATHLVTEIATGKSYKMAISMGTRVVHPEWLDKAWSVRNDISVSVTGLSFISPFLLEPFCGLSIWFTGFSREEEADMRAKVVEHKGYVAKTPDEATHVVVANAVDELPDENEKKTQRMVTAEWFWISIQLNCCANEDLYQWKGARRPNKKRAAMSPLGPKDGAVPSRRSLSRSSMEMLENSNSSALPDYSEHHFSSNDKLATSPKKVDKRHAVCKEMLETEENYLKALKIIVQSFKEPLEEQLANPEAGLLSKAEITQIFSRVPPLISVHEKICSDLRACVMHWSSDRLIGKIWLDSAEYLDPVYKAFINSYDTACQTLDCCDRSKPKFHAFLKAAESRAECQRNHLNDLLVRPVQRIPSVLLLLKAILKKTDRGNPDAPYLSKAMKALERVLANANESRRQTETYTQIFRISNEIDHCPAETLSSARTLMSELHVLSLGGEEEWAKTRGRLMTIFLFNDLIEIVKVRSGFTGNDENSSSSMMNTTLSRQFSFGTLNRVKKKYKHYQQQMLTSIRWIDFITHRDISGVFVISFRMYGTESFWVAQCQENQPDETRSFLKVLTNQIFYLCGRTVAETNLDMNDDVADDKDIDYTRNGLGSKEYKKSISKALHYAVRRNGASQNFVRPQSQLFPGLRRAASQVQIGITNTLSRFQSRAHLATISELPNTPRGRNTVAAAPHRSLRQMISASTFLPNRLIRGDSMRSSRAVSAVPME